MKTLGEFTSHLISSEFIQYTILIHFLLTSRLDKVGISQRNTDPSPPHPVSSTILISFWQALFRLNQASFGPAKPLLWKQHNKLISSGALRAECLLRNSCQQLLKVHMLDYRLLGKWNLQPASLASVSFSAQFQVTNTVLSLASYLQGLQEPERSQPPATGDQTESGIVQHFTIIIPNKREREKTRE